MHDMYKMWYLAEEDLLDPSSPYELTNTGQVRTQWTSAAHCAAHRVAHSVAHRVAHPVAHSVAFRVAHPVAHSVAHHVAHSVAHCVAQGLQRMQACPRTRKAVEDVLGLVMPLWCSSCASPPPAGEREGRVGRQPDNPPR